MKSTLKITFAMLSLSIAACSNGGGGSGATPVPSPVATPTTTTPTTPNTIPVVNGKYTYQFSTNTCSTGRREFTSVKGYCDAMLNDALNNNCARELRVAAFNRLCVNGGTVIQPGTMNIMNSARCVVNGSDLKDRTLLQSLNPFNPRNRQVIRDIFWDGRADRSYDILGTISATFGRAKFTMNASQRNLPAEGVVGLVQGNGSDAYLVRSNLGSQISLFVQNESAQQETQVVCMSDSSFKKPKVDLHQVRCTYKSDGNRNPREELVNWDMRSETSKQIFGNSASENISLRLKPAMNGQDEKVELEIADLDYDKSMRAESTLNEGLEIRFSSRDSGINIVLSCAPASK
ncbi:hypothetical protein [Bdellovibrio svalbardensis]|uniref:Lipoprotein n=1 Tax=Bdellovibrio svalbardensis TaxID=2972972 RepID=A0ABT6DE43_9BACT|nr:hypothetical protein [Bdellovibrio svalbardensis]MDG0814757.1 hypothetical protein [Bdellovibrio svalbardensis]